MLYQLAIMKRPEDVGNDEEIVYGPVNLAGSRTDDVTNMANRVIAQAAAEGKLPGGWTHRHYVAGISFSHFT